MSNRQSNCSWTRQTGPTDRTEKKSWHHRMARLIRDAYDVKCGAARCPEAASFICEWDQQGSAVHRRLGRAVSRQKLYCSQHAGNFAQHHQIYAANLPAVKLSQLESASRDDWAYAEDLPKQSDSSDRSDRSDRSDKSDKRIGEL